MIFGCCRWAELVSYFLQHNNLRRMAFLHILLSILGTISWATEVDTLAPPVDIYWNRTNDIFLRSNNDHIVQVQIKKE
ncbi:hypothetical protein EB796_017217 [Bugula neritina]|uniref:Ephrin RBD domain-containing protein n=1 Tax=Bugula neritina TaxID=10212 RepID=A0A7J7JED2_BUGNE|nr:hypothetical protein EB796_017217 [Bugula neritina]